MSAGTYRRGKKLLIVSRQPLEEPWSTVTFPLIPLYFAFPIHSLQPTKQIHPLEARYILWAAKSGWPNIRIGIGGKYSGGNCLGGGIPPTLKRYYLTSCRFFKTGNKGKSPWNKNGKNSTGNIWIECWEVRASVMFLSLCPPIGEMHPPSDLWPLSERKKKWGYIQNLRVVFQ